MDKLMSQKEVKRGPVLDLLGDGKISQKDASKGMGYRHVKFNRKKF